MLNSYKELKVWQKSMDLVMEIYKLTKFFPKEEIYGITRQMRRAASSIPANIAEGFTRKHRKEYSHFIRIAFGSGAELETHIAIAEKLQFTKENNFSETKSLLDEVMCMLNVLQKKLTTSN